MRAMEGVGFILGRGIALPQLGMGAVPQKHCENLATNINKILHIFYQIHLLNLLPATAAIEYVAACWVSGGGGGGGGAAIDRGDFGRYY